MEKGGKYNRGEENYETTVVTIQKTVFEGTVSETNTLK